MLVACGGGGVTGGANTSTPILTVTGTGATGLAISGATVTAKCKVGMGTAITQADGSYSLPIADGQLPCILQITNPVDGAKLHTVAFGTGSAATANITPLTEMATARVLGSEPNVFFAAFDVAVATQKISSNAVQSAVTDVGLVLTGTVDTTALGNFISTPLKAATQGNPNSGDIQDKLLDALKLKLSSANVATLVTALANNQTTDAIKQTVSNLTTVPSTPPVANAGTAQNVVAGTTVTLDASSSSASSGKTLTYAWTLTSKPAGSSAALSAPTTVKPTFVADLAGNYVASVVVNDGLTNSSVVAVTIMAAVANAPPVANAGGAQNVIAGTLVTLDGSASSDANNDPLTYVWTLTSKPAGSTAILSSSNSAKPTFVTDLAGNYVAGLVVNDGKVNSAGATVSVTATVANAAPVANAGVAQSVTSGSVVTLDGSGSTDANGDSLTYAWNLTSKPLGSSAVLSSISATKPTFTADGSGIYVATLVVNDGKVNSTAATVTVTATPSTATTLSSFSPNLGPVGQWVYVYGSNFVSGQTTISMGGVSSIPTTLYDSSSLGFTVPLGAAGTTNIVVTSPNGSATSTQTFTVGVPVGLPTITQITADLGPVGQLVGIYGSNFVNGQTMVTMGGVSSIPTQVGSPGYLQFTVPLGATGISNVVVTTPNGSATSAQTFTVGVPTGAPTVTSITPTAASVGQTVYVYGTNFVGGQTTISVGGLSSIPTNLGNASGLNFTVPVGASGTTTIVVTTPNGTARSSQTFTVQ